MQIISALLGILLIISCNDQQGIQQVPITTTSEEAKSHYLKARFFQNMRQLDSAENELSAALKKDSTFAMAYMMKGMIAEDFRDRRHYIAQAMKYVPNATKGEQLWIKARNAYYGTQEGDTTEFEYFRQLVNLYPEDYFANYLFGFVNHHHGTSEIDTAIRYLNKAISIKEDFTLAIEDLAYAYMEKGNFIDAEKYASANIALLPGLAEPLNTHAEILMRMGKHRESIEVYRKVLDLNPSSAWSIIGIAANLNYQSKHREAREELNRLDDFENISDYHFRHKWRARVVSFLDEGKVDSALNVLERQKQLGLKNLTDHEPLFHAYMSYMRKTDLLFRMGDHINGKKEYQNWLAFVEATISRESTIRNIQNLGSFYNAYGHYHRGEFDLALKDLEIYQDLVGEENEKFLELKAKILWNTGQDAEALKTVHSMGQENPYYLYLAAAILKDANHSEEGAEMIEKINSMYLIDDIDLAYTRSIIQ